MPRQARLDAPGTLHHVMVRGLAAAGIVLDDVDRAEFVAALADVATDTRTTIYAWALLPNHAHLLLRSGPAGLPRFMRRLLTRYAVRFNRRHKRVGHLFQNRYKSIVCDETPYFQELVRYIHLNPLRARLVADLAELERYPWSGHAATVGRIVQPWLDREYVLAQFGPQRKTARRAYREYVAAGVPLGRRPELVGGGLVRSLGGWAEVLAARSRRAAMAADPRVLGNGEFVEQLLREVEPGRKVGIASRRQAQEADRALRGICRRAGATVEELRAGSRRAMLPQVRAEAARRLVTGLGLSLAETARQLGVTTSAVSKMVGERRHAKAS